MPAPRFGETDEEVQNEAQKSILRVFHALILSDFFGASALAAALVEGGAEETFSYYDFPPTHWRSIRTNNPLERINRELRRRTRVVGNFPDGQSALMLVCARLRYIAGHKWGTERYLNMRPLYQPAL